MVRSKKLVANAYEDVVHSLRRYLGDLSSGGLLYPNVDKVKLGVGGFLERFGNATTNALACHNSKGYFMDIPLLALVGSNTSMDPDHASVTLLLERCRRDEPDAIFGSLCSRHG